MLAKATRAKTSPYLISAPVDLALIGGLSLAVCAVYRWTDLGDLSARLLAGGVLTFLVNWPHFAATSVRLYGSKNSIAQYPITAVAAPLVVLLLIVASLRSPLLIAAIRHSSRLSGPITGLPSTWSSSASMAAA